MAKRSKIPAKIRSYREELESIGPSYDIALTAILFTQASKSFEKVLGKVLKPMAITDEQYLTLWALLVSDKPLTPTKISQLLPVDTRSVSASLDRLHARKLIIRRRSAHDRRSVNITLTAEGERLIKESFPTLRRMLSDVFQTFSSRETSSLKRLVRKLRDASVSRLDGNIDYPNILIERFAAVVARLQAPETVQHQPESEE